jgi:RNA polymerase sigma-70 factor (ECF subfamily)
MLGKLALIRPRERNTSFDPAVHLDDVLRYAFFRLGSMEDAEDVAAQVLHDARRMGERLATIQDARLYMLGMTRRKVAGALRKRGRHSRARSLDDPSFLPPSTDGDVAATHRRLLVSQVLRQLPDDQREALALKYLHGLSAEEIAPLIQRTPTAVNSLLQRAREAFARLAGDAFDTE